MYAFFHKWFERLDLLRRITLNLLFLALLVLLFVSLGGRSGIPLPQSGILVFHPQGSLVESIEVPGGGLLLQGLPRTNQIPVHEVTRLLRDAATDPNIQALQLELDELAPAPLARLDMLRHAIESFRASGKPVISVGNRYSQEQYYIASVANRIVLHPLGLVEIKGFGIYRNYFHQALNSLHIDVHLVHAGKYKSAAEPLIRDDMSAAAREANRQWLEQLWLQYKNNIRKYRQLAPGLIQRLADHPEPFMQASGGDAARLALQNGLVDQLGDTHQTQQTLAALLNVDASSLPKQIDYRQYSHPSIDLPAENDKSRIGIIIANGPVLEGEQPEGSIGAASLSRQIHQAADDEQYRALIIRLNSPGGSALASETIRQAVIDARSKKPVIVSIGSVAASGGYWIASAADQIWAEPATLTGSIGVFGVLAKMHRSLEQLGIHSDGLGTANMAGAMLPDRPLPEELRRAIQLGVDHIYTHFIDIVATGRKQPREAIALAAEGRVWTARDALQRHLIDAIGSLDDAVDAAARQAGITDQAYERVWIRSERKWQERLAKHLLGGLMASLPRSPWLNTLSQEWAQWQPLQQMLQQSTRIYAYAMELPY